MATNTLSILKPSVNNLTTRIFVRSAGLDFAEEVGGDEPSIADIRLAATLEFLRAIDYDFPAWLEEYMSRTEAALGAAYSEPAQDVRDYVAYVKSQAG